MAEVRIILHGLESTDNRLSVLRILRDVYWIPVAEASQLLKTVPVRLPVLYGQALDAVVQQLTLAGAIVSVESKEEDVVEIKSVFDRLLDEDDPC